MTIKYLIGGLSIVLAHSVFALPKLSEPSDIISTSGQGIIEIMNSNDDSILECQLASGKLQGCQTKRPSGLLAPYRAVSIVKDRHFPRVYVTQKDTSNIFSFTTDARGIIEPNAEVEKVASLPFDGVGGNILEFRSSLFSNDDYSQRFYISRSVSDSDRNYGQFESLVLGVDKPDVNGWMTYQNVNLPVFSIEPFNTQADDIIGAGRVEDKLGKEDYRFPFLSRIRGGNGSLIEACNEGGNPNFVKTPLSSDVNSIAKIDGKYWITYKSKKKFTRFDNFPDEKAVDEDKYQAPSNANVRLKVLPTYDTGSKTDTNFALFADDNKIGICTGDSDFTCTDAFRYLAVVYTLKSYIYNYSTGFASSSLGDHGTVIFGNVNHSPITADEITSDFSIPDDVKSAFSGSCIDKIDFSPLPLNTAEDDGNDTCRLNFDFRKLSNLPPISESFDVGFTVKGPFGDVPTKFHFDLNLPTSTPHLEFQKDGEPLNELNANAGDTQSFDIIYLSNGDQTINPQTQLSFLNGKDNSATFRSYFSDTGCLSSNAPQLASGDTCTLTFNIPADANNQNFTLQLSNPVNTPSEDNTLAVSVSSTANIIAHSPYGNQSIETLSPIHSIDMQPGTETVVRFTNVGAAAAHNFSVHFVQQQSQYHIPLILSGDCTKNPELKPYGGHCNLRIKLDKSDTTFGKFGLQVSADDITNYTIPITLGGFPIEQGIGVVDLQTGFVGTPNIYKGTSGALKVTNYTGHELIGGTLKIFLPVLNLGAGTDHPDSIFLVQDKNTKIKSCITNIITGANAVELAPLESCVIMYSLGSGVTVTPQNTGITFQYANDMNEKTHYEGQALHFTNQDGIGVSVANSNIPLDKVILDASMPKTVLVFTNNLDKPIKGLNVTENTGGAIVSNNTCKTDSLAAGEVCSLTVSLDDNHPMMGNYQLKITADNLNERDIPLTIQQAQTDTVEVDNRGGYSMSVDYINYHSNSDGNDGQCLSGACYGKTSTGWFTNPFNTQITGVSGRQLHMYMMAGVSVSLPSCDGGKIVCTGTTLAPYCVYVDDGSTENTPQNQCLKYNP